MIIDNEKIVLLGDLHFGKNKFSPVTFESQMRFFEYQLFPYMLNNGIKYIIQAGDVFDNRINMDIEYFQNLQEKFFDRVKELGFKFICIVGNHDIYHKSSRKYTILNTIDRLYDNVTVINERVEYQINGKKWYFIPWILPNETITSDELTGMNYVMGHFEIRNFEMAKGHLDDHSMLSPEFFKKKRALKKVYSGHYHIKSEKEKIEYLGTPYWLDWGDYATRRGFYVLDEECNEEFIENNQSTKFIKLKYKESDEKPLMVSGLEIGKNISVDLDTLDVVSESLKPHRLKLFINESETNKHEEYIYMMKQAGLEFEITNNVEISAIIGEAYKPEEKDENGNDIKIPTSSKGLIKDTIKSKNPTLVSVLEELFRELDEN